MDPICTHTPWLSSLPPPAPPNRVKQRLTWIFNSQKRQNNWESTWVLLEIYSLIFTSSTLRDFSVFSGCFLPFGWLTKSLNGGSVCCQLCLPGQTSEPCRSGGGNAGKQLLTLSTGAYWLNIIELYMRRAVSLLVCDGFSGWLNWGEGRVSVCFVCPPWSVCVCVCVCVCIHMWNH